MRSVIVVYLKGFAFVTGLLMAGTFIAPAVTARTEGSAGLISVGSMHELRGSHTATLLPDGKVLIAGGFKKVRQHDQVYFKTAELYDPHCRSFTPTGDMNVARCGHTATLLADGTILILGGNNERPLSGAEIYDPRTGKFAPAGEMSGPREGHTATRLTDGNVLIVGGDGAGNWRAEIFDITIHRFRQAGSLSTGRQGHTATLLRTGEVLIAGGRAVGGGGESILSSAEVYDQRRGEFTPTGNLTMVRYKHAASLLRDGTVLVVGGSDNLGWQGQYATAELYDPGKKVFVRVADMSGKRFKFRGAITPLTDGRVLIAGGNARAEIYDPQKKSFSTVATFGEAHYFATATLLTDGGVLVSGGYNTQPQSTDKAWLFTQ